MTFSKLLRVLPAVLGVAAALAAIGTSVFGDMRFGASPPKAADPTVRPDGTRLVEELAATKFSQLPTLSYQLRNGETLFAWQVRPKAIESPARSRDLLILVDTSASQAGKPLMQARQIIQALARSSDAERPTEHLVAEHPGRDPVDHQGLRRRRFGRRPAGRHRPHRC